MLNAQITAVSDRKIEKKIRFGHYETSPGSISWYGGSNLFSAAEVLVESQKRPQIRDFCSRFDLGTCIARLCRSESRISKNSLHIEKLVSSAQAKNSSSLLCRTAAYFANNLLYMNKETQNTNFETPYWTVVQVGTSESSVPRSQKRNFFLLFTRQQDNHASFHFWTAHMSNSEPRSFHRRAPGLSGLRAWLRVLGI